MIYKKCTKCGKLKHEINFPPRRNSLDGRSSWCSDCTREYTRADYHKNKQRYMARAKQRDQELRNLIRSRKAVPCADCGIQYPYYVMDFDHLEEKLFNIANMIARRMAVDKIIAEMDKCEVVCSNCHRARTHFRRVGDY